MLDRVRLQSFKLCDPRIDVTANGYGSSELVSCFEQKGFDLSAVAEAKARTEWLKLDRQKRSSLSP